MEEWKGQATDQQVAEWKKQYGEVYAVKVDGYVCYLKKPSRKAIGYASMAGKENPMKFNEIMLNECYIGGAEEVKTDDTLFLSVSSKIADLVTIKEAALEKL